MTRAREAERKEAWSRTLRLSRMWGDTATVKTLFGETKKITRDAYQEMLKRHGWN